ncbi:MAG: hypothetical protein H7A21_06215 [Spirochaetales bacterium]|nr:hypothetical protein [Leptospiraceae bacterium]MCP5481006.1 hypothetical protein [Spirochaetales bacterium]MCP5485386.1 hypothetical protein [Spirochaetales bacterium]
MSSEIVTALISSFGVLAAGIIVCVVLLLYAPEKIEKWASLLAKWLSKIRVFSSAAHRRYVKFDLQGRLNEFLKRKARQNPFFAVDRVRLEYVEPDIDRQAFLQKDAVLVRIRRHDPRDLNFVFATHLWVSTALLHTIKRYLAPTQRESLDLYVTSKILEEQKPHIRGYFLDHYLHNRVAENTKVRDYYSTYVHIDERGLFFAVYMQELEAIGSHVFGKPQSQAVAKEVKDMLEFLSRIADRELGEESDLEFNHKVSSFAIVIVGKKEKIEYSIEPYVTFIQNGLLPKGIVNIHLLGALQRKTLIDQISYRFTDQYDRVPGRIDKIRLRLASQNWREHTQYSVLLRKKNLPFMVRED